MSNEQCIHHWVIDELNVGRCKKCPAVKDFGALLNKDKNFGRLIYLEIGRETGKGRQAIKF